MVVDFLKNFIPAHATTLGWKAVHVNQGRFGGESDWMLGSGECWEVVSGKLEVESGKTLRNVELGMSWLEKLEEVSRFRPTHHFPLTISQ
jgi:hypothetical protein